MSGLALGLLFNSLWALRQKGLETPAFNKVFPSCSCGTRPNNLGQGSLNLPHLWRHPQKIWNPELKIC